jgi:hypothetical protein
MHCIGPLERLTTKYYPKGDKMAKSDKDVRVVALSMLTENPEFGRSSKPKRKIRNKRDRQNWRKEANEYITR